MVTRKYVDVEKLQCGMVIDQSIIDGTGRLLVVRKTVLDRKMIQSLQNLNIVGVYIREGEEEFDTSQELNATLAMKKADKLIQPDRAYIYLAEDVKKRILDGMKFIMQYPSENEVVVAAHDVARELVNSMNVSDAVAFNIHALKVCDDYTFKHSVDVAAIAMIVAKQNKMSEEHVYQIGIAGLLHDLGKTKIPDEILNKPAKLTDEEYRIIKKHPVYGYEMLKGAKNISNEILRAVLQHHEKINGSGYPLGLTNNQISFYAKMIAVADIFDALITERPYKAGFSPRDAIEMLMAMTRELDINVVRMFMNSVILYPTGSVVQLSNGEKAKVVENSSFYPTRPKVVGLKTGNVYDLADNMKCASLIVE